MYVEIMVAVQRNEIVERTLVISEKQIFAVLRSVAVTITLRLGHRVGLGVFVPCILDAMRVEIFEYSFASVHNSCKYTSKTPTPQLCRHAF